jgi:sugar lactone lactonase YvrE
VTLHPAIRALGVVLLLLIAVPGPATGAQPSVVRDHWLPCEDWYVDVDVDVPFCEAIAWMAAEEVASGWPDGTFRPRLPVSRQTMAAWLYRASGSPTFSPPDSPSFADVPLSHGFFTEIEWLAAAGAATGWPDGTFRPSAPVSRQGMAAFLHRLVGSPPSTPPPLPTFVDVDTSHPFRVEIEWLAATGTTEGWPDGTFRPGLSTTRQAMAGFLQRFIATRSPGIATIAGDDDGGYTGDGGPAHDATLLFPQDVAIGPDGSLYITDRVNDAIRRVAPSGVISTIAGGNGTGYTGDGGPAIDAQLGQPQGIAVDDDGRIYFTERFNHTVRRVDESGTITTVAGGNGAGYSGDDGAATDATFDDLHDIEVDASGALLVADTGNHAIRRIVVGGEVDTLAGGIGPGYSGDDGLATDAKLNGPEGIALDDTGGIYVADRSNFAVRFVSSGGTITTVAGGNGHGHAGDGGPAGDAQLSAPNDVLVDADGGVLISQIGVYVGIRHVDALGTITTVAGNGDRGHAGDGGAPLDAEMFPHGMALDPHGDVVVAERDNHTVRLIR